MISSPPPPDPIAAKTLWYTILSAYAAIAGAVIALLAAIAAAWALYYAKHGPSKEDLKRVEDNTKETATHVKAVRQHTSETADHIEAVKDHIASVDDHVTEMRKSEALSDELYRLSVLVTGGGRVAGPLNLTFTLQDADVTLHRVELVNDNKVLAGVADCVRSQPLVFTAAINPVLANQWFNSSKPESHAPDRSLGFRLLLTLKGDEAYKSYIVWMRQASQQGPGGPGTSENIWVLSEIM